MIYKIFLLLGIGLNILAQLLLKKGMAGLDIIFSGHSFFDKFKMMLFNPWFWASIFSYGLGFVIYAIVLSRIRLNVAYPVASVLAIVVIYIFSVAYFKEATSFTGITGLIMCVIGIMLLLK